jgi:nicotinamide riboside transporter PnuC
LESNVKATWWRSIATPVLWFGTVGLLRALGAWLLFVYMAGAIADVGIDAAIRIALAAALVAGIALSRRSRGGYLILALAAVACVVLFAGAFVDGSLVGTVALLLAAVTAAAAFARWFTFAATEGEPEVEAAGRAAATPRSPVETAAAMSLAIAGLLVLGRVV